LLDGTGVTDKLLATEILLVTKLDNAIIIIIGIIPVAEDRNFDGFDADVAALLFLEPFALIRDKFIGSFEPANRR